MGFLIFALHFAGSDPELRIGGPGIAVEVLYQVSNVFVYPMEEAVFEVLLYLSVCDSSRALQPDLIEGPFEPPWQRREPFCGALGDLIEVLHENVKQHFTTKNNLVFGGYGLCWW